MPQISALLWLTTTFVYALAGEAAVVSPLQARLERTESSAPDNAIVSRRQHHRVLPRALASSLDTPSDHHLHHEQHRHHGHEHGVPCGHSIVERRQEASVREFRAFLKRRDKTDAGGSSKDQTSRRLFSSSSFPAASLDAATIRIQTELQLSSLSAAQQQAVKSVVSTAVGVIKKFIKVVNR